VRAPDRMLRGTLAFATIGMASAALCAFAAIVYLLFKSEIIAPAFWPIVIVLVWLAIAVFVGVRAGRWLVKTVLTRSGRPMFDVFLVIVMVALLAFSWLDSDLRIVTPLHLAVIVVLLPLIAGTGFGAGARLFGRRL